MNFKHVSDYSLKRHVVNYQCLPFQVHILNSIVAEQQNKIMDLEKKLQETSKHHPTPPPADGPVSPVL